MRGHKNLQISESTGLKIPEFGGRMGPLVQLLQPEKAKTPVETQETPEINKTRNPEHAGHPKSADLTIAGPGNP